MSKDNISKIDVARGAMTYGQRIKLGEIAQAGGEDLAVVKAVIKCLHDIDDIQITKRNALFLVEYTTEVLEAIYSWVKKEQQALSYTPTPEELRAGIKELSTKTGDFGTIKALAKTYAKDPDEILTWQYGKVFALLVTDFEEHKFAKRYEKIIAAKHKNK